MCDNWFSTPKKLRSQAGSKESSKSTKFAPQPQNDQKLAMLEKCEAQCEEEFLNKGV